MMAKQLMAKSNAVHDNPICYMNTFVLADYPQLAVGLVPMSSHSCYCTQLNGLYRLYAFLH